MIVRSSTSGVAARLLAPLALALCTLGCDEEVTLDAKVMEATGEKYVIEVKTRPGVKVEVGRSSATTDAQGVARLEVKPSDVEYLGDSRNLSLRAEGGSIFKSYFGFGDVELPFSPKEAANRPTGDDWLKVQGGGRNIDQDAGALWLFDEVGGAYTNEQGGLDLELLAVPGAKIGFAGKSVTTDELGKATLRFDRAEVFAMIPSSDLAYASGRKPRELEATVQVGAGPAKPVKLRGAWSISGRFLKPYLQRVVDQPLGGERNAEPLVLYVDLRDVPYSGGRSGMLDAVDVVGLGKAQPERKLSDCDGYQLIRDGKPVSGTFSLPRVAIDEEVVAYDARSGKELGRKTFTAREICPVDKRSTDSSLKVYPDPLPVLGWLIEVGGGAAPSGEPAPADAP